MYFSDFYEVISWAFLVKLVLGKYHRISIDDKSTLVQLTHLPLNKMAAILQTVFSDTILLMKSFVFWLMFVPKGPIDKHKRYIS